MALPAAFLGVILIWSTTPLAIKWSGDGPGFLFGAMSRMTLSLPLCLLLLWLLRQPLRRDFSAWRVYTIAGVQVYASMMATYWAAQHVASGLISVMFGLTPLVTAILAALLLREQGLSPVRLLGTALGILGLVEIFGMHVSGLNVLALGMVLLGVVLQSLSAVLLKRYDPGLPAVAVTTGALMVGVPCYLITWLASAAFTGVLWPHELSNRSAGAIVYLAVFGSTIGFVLYYHILKHAGASKAALITLVTPVSALLLGHLLDGEPITAQVWYGTALILGGLATHQWGDVVLRRLAWG